MPELTRKQKAARYVAAADKVDSLEAALVVARQEMEQAQADLHADVHGKTRRNGSVTRSQPRDGVPTHGVA